MAGQRFPWIKAAAGPHSCSSWSRQARLSDWWRDRPQIDDGVARMGGGVTVSSLLMIEAWFTLIVHLLTSESSKNLLFMRGVEWEERSQLPTLGYKKEGTIDGTHPRTWGFFTWAKPFKASSSFSSILLRKVFSAMTSASVHLGSAPL